MPKQSLILKTNDDIAACSDADTLLGALKSCASDILQNLGRMAAILRRLDELGVEVTIDHALIPYIRMIANGQLSASCFVACAADPKLLQKAVTLPLPLQEKIARDEPFEVLDHGGSKREVKPSQMGDRELAQLFRNGRERTREEKLDWNQKSEKFSATAKASDRSMIDGDTGPRPQHSAVGVEMNWAAKKIVAAAVKYITNLEEKDDRRFEKNFDRSYDALKEAVDEYLELGAVA